MKKKYLIILLLAVILTANLSSMIEAAQPVRVMLNGEDLLFDVPPVLENGRVLVPYQVLFEALGAVATWDGDTKTITAKKEDVLQQDGTTWQDSGASNLVVATEVRLTADNKTAYRNGGTTQLDVPSKMANGQVLVPVRFVSEALNCEVEWDAGTRTVQITQKGKTELLAIEQVKKYLLLIERFYQYERGVGNGVSDAEWQEVLSQAAINSPYGIDGRVYRPMPGQVGSSVRSITDGTIIGSKVLSAQVNDASAIMVTGQYLFNDPTDPDSTQRKTQYLKNYYFIEENGRIVIDREEIIAATYQ